MFLPEDFWRQFGPPEQPAAVWAFASILFVFVAPVLVVLGCAVWEWVRGE